LNNNETCLSQTLLGHDVREVAKEMRVILRLSVYLCSVVLVISSALSATAANRVLNKYAKSGQPTLIYTFWSCSDKPPGGGNGSFVEHGTVTTREVVLHKCADVFESAPGVDVPAREIWYTSNPGFTGLDTVTIPSPGRSGHIIRILVQ
jgi:hypothetical protein